MQTTNIKLVGKEKYKVEDNHTKKFWQIQKKKPWENIGVKPVHIQRVPKHIVHEKVADFLKRWPYDLIKFHVILKPMAFSIIDEDIKKFHQFKLDVILLIL